MLKITGIILGLLLTFQCFAKTKSEKEARVLADHYFSSYSVKSALILKNSFSVQYNGTTVYHVFNYEGGGFVMVSASDAVTPILAQSDEGFVAENITNPAVKYWFDSYAKEIEYIITKNLDNIETLKQWNNILGTTHEKSVFDAGPLLTTEWDQGEWYNYYCPADPKGPGGHVDAGCTATAMAQIMKYYNFPEKGFLSHSYEVPDYGVQTVNFGETTYNWGAMGKTANNTSYQDIAKLIYHAGVSDDMVYNISGSGAPTANVPWALSTYFNYDPKLIKHLKLADYTVSDWKELLKTELHSSRPVLYVGYGSITGHSWVCDGWRWSDDMFHMNWGWSGKENGWFRIGELNTNIGGYNKDNEIITGIKPGNPNMVVRITNLNPNQLIACNSSVAIDCSVLKGSPNSVTIYVDNIKKYTANQSKFTFNLLTKDYSIGNHIIKVEAVNSKDTAYHEVMVRNSEWISQATAFSKPLRGISCLHAVDSLVVWAIAYDSNGDRFPINEFTRTENGGDTWKSGVISGCDGLRHSMIFALNSKTAYCPMSLQSGTNPKGIYVTMDAGNTWKRQTSASFSDPASFPNVVHFFDQNNGFCMGDPVGGEYEIYTTSDGGNSWIKVAAENIPNPLASEEGITGYYSSIGDNAWFGTTKGRVYRSNDRGRHWDVSSTSFNGNTVDVDFADQFHGLAQNKSNKTTGTLSETFDGGVTWSLVKTTGPMGSEDLCFVPGTENTWASTGNPSSGVFYSCDGGHSWVPFVGNENEQVIKIDFVSPETGWAGGFNASASVGGMYKFVGKIKCQKILNPVTKLVASVAGKNINLEWNAPAIDTISGYKLYRNDTLLTEIPVSNRNYIDKGVAAGKQKYCVVAVSPEGESVAVCADAFIMSPITNLVATVNNRCVALDWKAPAIGVGEMDIDYNLYRNDTLLNQYPFNVIWGIGDCPYIPLTIGKKTYCVVAIYKSVKSEPVCTDVWITTGIPENKTNINVYPNPATDKITIETSLNFDKISIYNLPGQKVYNHQNPGNYLTIPTTEIPPGIYILQIDFENKTDNRKISIN
jgi:photosystem II stability/assembly factor-like uncharacterized protein